MSEANETAPTPPERKRTMGLESLGGILVVLGLTLALVGGGLLLLNRFTGDTPFKLPGDVQIQVGNISCFFPIVSMIVISIVLSIIANVIIRLFNR
jgi:hypothetical protein